MAKVLFYALILPIFVMVLIGKLFMHPWLFWAIPLMIVVGVVALAGVGIAIATRRDMRMIRSDNAAFADAGAIAMLSPGGERKVDVHAPALSLGKARKR